MFNHIWSPETTFPNVLLAAVGTLLDFVLLHGGCTLAYALPGRYFWESEHRLSVDLWLEWTIDVALVLGVAKGINKVLLDIVKLLPPC